MNSKNIIYNAVSYIAFIERYHSGTDLYQRRLKQVFGHGIIGKIRHLAWKLSNKTNFLPLICALSIPYVSFEKIGKTVISDHSNEFIKNSIIKKKHILKKEIRLRKIKSEYLKITRGLIESGLLVDEIKIFQTIRFFKYLTYFENYLSKHRIEYVYCVDDVTPLRAALLVAANNDQTVKEIHLCRLAKQTDRFDALPRTHDHIWDNSQISVNSTTYELIKLPNKKISFEVLRNQNLKFAIAGPKNMTPEKVLPLLRELSRLTSSTIKVRLHPLASSKKWHSLKEKVEITSGKQDIEEFSNQVDLVFCGNTSLIEILLSYGVPVVYVSNLDEEVDDIYKYVKTGEIPKAHFPIITSQISEFYEKKYQK